MRYPEGQLAIRSATPKEYYIEQKLISSPPGEGGYNLATTDPELEDRDGRLTSSCGRTGYGLELQGHTDGSVAATVNRNAHLFVFNPAQLNGSNGRLVTVSIQ